MPAVRLPCAPFGRQPDHSTGDGQLLVFAHEVQQHEHFVAEAVIAVGRDEQPAILHERHVGEIQRALVLDGERQQSRFVGAGAACSTFAHGRAQRHSSASTAMVLLIEVWASLRMSRMASENSNRRHILGGNAAPDKCVTSRIDAVSRMRSVTQLSRHERRIARSLSAPSARPPRAAEDCRYRCPQAW